MSDQSLAHEMKDLAASYALGALTQHEARAFEEHLSGACEICSAELESFEQTVNDLALGVSEEAPPERLRSDLLARLNSLPSAGEKGRVPASREFLSILAGEGEWQQLLEGVLIKQLHLDRASGIATSLVRMLPGTALPPHRHSGTEQFFVIEGDCSVRGQELGPGDFHRADAGSVHETTYTVNGTLFLLVAPEAYELLEARS